MNAVCSTLDSVGLDEERTRARKLSLEFVFLGPLLQIPSLGDGVNSWSVSSSGLGVIYTRSLFFYFTAVGGFISPFTKGDDGIEGWVGLLPNPRNSEEDEEQPNSDPNRPLPELLVLEEAGYLARYHVSQVNDSQLGGP